MQIHIKKDVDFILIDFLCRLSHHERIGINLQLLDMLPERIRDPILQMPHPVGIDLKPIAIVHRHEMLREIIHNILG